MSGNGKKIIYEGVNEKGDSYKCYNDGGYAYKNANGSDYFNTGKVMASTRVALKEVTLQEEKNTVLITITTKATPLLSSSKQTLPNVQFMNDPFVLLWLIFSFFF